MAIAVGLAGKDAFVAMPDETHERWTAFRYPDTALVPLGGVPWNWPDVIVANGDYRVLTNLEQESLARKLLASCFPEVALDAQVCLLRMKSDATTQAAFCVVMVQGDAVNNFRAEDAGAMLQRLADLLAVGRRFEENRRDAQVARPLAVLGSMFSGLEHETRSPISMMKRALEFLSEKDRSSEDIRRMLDSLRNQTFRLEDSLTRMISLVGVSRQAFRAVDVVSTVNSTIDKLISRGEVMADVIRDFALPKVLVLWH